MSGFDVEKHRPPVHVGWLSGLFRTQFRRVCTVVSIAFHRKLKILSLCTGALSLCTSGDEMPENNYFVQLLLDFVSARLSSVKNAEHIAISIIYSYFIVFSSAHGWASMLQNLFCLHPW
jgi:hypothetical protein